MNKISLALICVAFILDSCCNGNFVVPVKELPVTDVTYLFNDGCSDPFAFTTEDGIPQGGAGTCWNNRQPLHTKWFKFTNSYSYTGITIQLGQGYGTQRKTLLTLWDSERKQEIDCASYESFNDDAAMVSISSSGLSNGETYYIAVDVADTESKGTFAMCLYWD